jgi:membrane fusion protein, multidrug efflux system
MSVPDLKGPIHMAATDTRQTEKVKVLDEGPPEPRRRSKRWWIAGLALALAAAAGVWYLLDDASTAEVDPEGAIELQFSEVVTTDLLETSEYEGTMGRLDGNPVSIRREGTVTAVPEEGATLEQGDVVAWIDNEPVILLYGELPIWRIMSDDVEGPDVLQLETALTALGFNESEASMTVDDTYTGSTESVVETWQESIGADEDGVVDLGDVLFLPGPVRVDALQVSVGDQVASGTAIFTTSGDDLEIDFDLPTSEQDNVSVGDAVEVTLPDLSTTTGSVTEISTVATRPEDGGEASFEVVVVLDDPSVADGIDEAPVTVDVITDRVDGVTALPVEALVALAEGGYAVEVADGAETRLVAVEPGFYADGLVEVTGEVSPGDRVVVP